MPVGSLNVQQFLDAQERDYDTALNEIRSGRKTSHWIWYIFPQLTSLGRSEMATRFGIEDLKQAATYLEHPVLAARLVEISNALLNLPDNNPQSIMGYPDDLKLRSSMTLFSMVPGANIVFERVIDKFFDGEKDRSTMQRL